MRLRWSAVQHQQQKEPTVQSAASLLQLHSETHRSLALLLRHSAHFSDEELGREFPGFGFPSLRAQLSHTIEVEDMWVAKLKVPSGGPLPFVWLENEPAETVAQLEHLRARIEVATAEWITRLGDNGLLNTPLTLRWSGKNAEYAEVRTPAFILLHACTHHFHHKGQAAAICRLLGNPAPDTDIQRPDY
jgi:uncharacterized damage-inducible protein DinB